MAAMTAVGLALQVKYSVALEGVYLGCVLLWRARRDREPMTRVAASAILWIGCAVMPTLLAFGWYAAHGHTREFLFCNFASVMGQVRRPALTELIGLVTIAGILSPLLAGVVAARPWRAEDTRTAIVAGWLITAAIAVLAYGRFDSPHYAMPLLVPACILLAPTLGGSQRRRMATLAALCVAWAGGQTVLAVSERMKGGRVAAEAVAIAARPTHGCIYVYDGYPALYMMTGSCLPTRWPFPGHLATLDEARPAALGVDPVAEVARILATRPVAIVDDFPRFAFGNPATRRVLEGVLTRDYHLAACVRTGETRVRLIYRRGAEPSKRAPRTCPTGL